MHPTPIIGITKGQMNDIVFAYDSGKEKRIVMRDADLHLYSKKDGTRCITVHTRFFSFALFGYHLAVVGKKKKLLLKMWSDSDKDICLNVYAMS